MLTYNGKLVTSPAGKVILPTRPEIFVRFQFSDTSYEPGNDAKPDNWYWVPVEAENGIWDCVLDTTGSTVYNWGDFSSKIVPSVIGDGNSASIITSLFEPSRPGTWLKFNSCTSLTNVRLNARGLSRLEYTFAECTNLTTVRIINAGSVTNMQETFNGCTALTSVFIDNTCSCTNMNGMFNRCSSLVTAPWMSTGNVQTMDSMFGYCTSLTTVPLYDMSSVLTAGAYTYGTPSPTSGMFGHCTSLVSVPDFDTRSLTRSNRMFEYCSSLVRTPNLNLSSVTNTSRMYLHCAALESSVDYKLSSVTDIEQMYYACVSLKKVPSISVPSAIRYGEGVFQECYNVETGALDLYNTWSTQSTFTYYGDCFKYCGSNTTTGAAELAQIPSSWGGTGT